MPNGGARLLYRMMRHRQESNYVNTINVRDRVRIEFVWYPGAASVGGSLVDVILSSTAAGQPRVVHYTFSRRGRPAVRRVMNSGRITVPLPQGQTGELEVFGTTWKITRVAAGTNMDGANTLKGIQQRLNRLGYHLRGPGRKNAGADNLFGRRTESAILAFQCDYRPAAGAPVAAANRLRVRGEWQNNPNIQANLNRYAGVTPPPNTANPSGTDGTALQAAVVTLVP